MEIPKIPDIFDVVITKEMISNTKPDPECYIVALKNLQEESSNTLGFENDKTGIEALLNTGIKAIGITNYHDKKVFGLYKDQIRVIKDFKDINII